jgi:hypothetical protein
VQTRIFAGRQIKTCRILALQHHAIGADIEIIRVGIARDHRIRRARIAATIARPMFRDRQEIEIDVITEHRIFIDAGFGRRDFLRGNARAQLVLGAADEFDRRRVRIFTERQRNTAHGWAEHIPE